MRAEPAWATGCQKEKGSSVIRLFQPTLETRLSYGDVLGGTEWGLLVRVLSTVLQQKTIGLEACSETTGSSLVSINTLCVLRTFLTYATLNTLRSSCQQHGGISYHPLWNFV